jgi:hypothetical protein
MMCDGLGEVFAQARERGLVDLCTLDGNILCTIFRRVKAFRSRDGPTGLLRTIEKTLRERDARFVRRFCWSRESGFQFRKYDPSRR